MSDKKVEILKNECREKLPQCTNLIENIYNHIEEHPNQEKDTAVFQLKQIIEEHTGGTDDI